MNENILQELNQLMARDETGMNVVLIDTARRLEELHRVYPGLAKRFECIGTSDSIKAKKAAAPVPSEFGKGSLAKAPEVVEKKVQPAPKPVAAPKEAPAPKTAATKAVVTSRQLRQSLQPNQQHSRKRRQLHQLKSVRFRHRL